MENRIAVSLFNGKTGSIHHGDAIRQWHFDRHCTGGNHPGMVKFFFKAEPTNMNAKLPNGVFRQAPSTLHVAKFL